MDDLQKCIKRFDTLMRKVHRKGKAKFLKQLKTDTLFFSVPASTYGPYACKGGLLKHSLAVYDRLMEKWKSPLWESTLGTLPEESLIIMALLHDSYNNISFALTEELIDNNSDVVKISENEYYVLKDNRPFCTEEFTAHRLFYTFPLTRSEFLAIRFHKDIDIFQNQYPIFKRKDSWDSMLSIVLALHEADLETEFINNPLED